MNVGWVGLLAALLTAGAWGQGQPVLVEHGTYTVNLLLHAIGTEEYRVEEPTAGKLVLSSRTTMNDRGMKRESTSELEMSRSFDPERLVQKSSGAGDTESVAEIRDGAATVREAGVSRAVEHAGGAFVGFASMPASLQMMMMRYWLAHRQPRELRMLRASAEAPPLEIRMVGHEAFQARGRMVRLTRYTVANLVFGREILWMNESGRLAAVMTFAGGLPQELVLDEYAGVGTQLVHSGIRQEMLDLADLTREVPAEAQGSYAIVGPRLIDGTGTAPVEHATVLVRGGRIAAAGAEVKVPAGMKVIHEEGRTLLPGLWEMHSHYSGVEFGPALLAAGVTTARDCGGEFEFLTALRRAIERQHMLGPRLVMAGLIDGGGPLAFGTVQADTPAEGVSSVDMYANAGFEQIKVYTQIQPEVLRAIAAEAHRRGMTVTGHVPAAVTTAEGIADGMDQINHLQYVTRELMVDGRLALESDQSRAAIGLLKDRGIVVDPTEGWGEMAGHPHSVDAATFEPGIGQAPFVLAAKYRGMGVEADQEPKWRERMETSRAVVRVLHEAGVTMVAGSDTGLVGYGLDRELELYVEAGWTPMEAIMAATSGAARVMKLDREVGTVEPGRRADLMVVDGNPLERISDLRRVVSVVTEGRMYSSARLARSVGFRR